MRKLDVKLEELAARSGEWLRGSGPDGDIVVSSRIRLARNLADYPFIRRCAPSDRTSIAKAVRTQVEAMPSEFQANYLDLERLSELDRNFLMERQLISRELSESEGARAVAVDPNERFSIMVNEEDHLRLQVVRSGLDLADAWEFMDRLDSQLEKSIRFAYHEKLGFLTACPTNVGTGLRVSVMLHLPALVITKQIDKVFRSLQRISVAVRGFFGEGSQFLGDFYQVSNQVTLGKAEVELVQKVGEVVPVLIDYERKAREFLLKESQQDLHDEVSRAMGILCNARKISSQETMHYLSKVRMGIHLGLLNNVALTTVNRLFLQTQPAHLQKLRGQQLTTAERNIARATFLQQHLMSNPPDNLKN